MNDPPTMNDLKKVNKKTLTGIAGEIVCEKGQI